MEAIFNVAAVLIENQNGSQGMAGYRCKHGALTWSMEKGETRVNF